MATTGHLVQVRDRYSGALLDLIAVEGTRYAHEAASRVREAVRLQLGTGKYRQHKTMTNIWLRVYQDGTPAAEAVRASWWDSMPRAGARTGVAPEVEALLAD